MLVRSSRAREQARAQAGPRLAIGRARWSIGAGAQWGCSDQALVCLVASGARLADSDYPSACRRQQHGLWGMNVFYNNGGTAGSQASSLGRFATAEAWPSRATFSSASASFSSASASVGWSVGWWAACCLHLGVTSFGADATWSSEGAVR